jgi:DNA-binding beta-propeller fold protein YncE
MTLRLVLIAFVGLGLTPAAAPARVGLGQPAGCVLQSRARPAVCGPGFGLLGVTALAASPDGTSLYAAGQFSYAVATLAREPLTGAIRWTGCISDDGTDGTFGGDGRCRDGDGLRGPTDVDVSPDGRNVYVTDPRASAIATFSRDPVSGALTPVACIANALGDSRCSDAAAMRAPRQLALSPDGRFAYVAASSSNAIDVLARDPATGSLRQVSCVSDNGTDGTCVDGAALRGATSVAISPDGAYLYVAARASGALLVFARDAETGALRQVGCLLHAAPTGVCTPTDPLQGASAVAISADGGTVAVARTTGVSAFSRDSASGALQPLGCLGGEGCPSLQRLSRPAAVMVAPGGGRMLVADRQASTIAVVTTGPAGLTEQGCLRGRQAFGPGECTGSSGLEGAAALAASADGRFAYAGADRGVVRLLVGGPW